MVICILGSTSQLAKTLIHFWKDDPDVELVLFSRSTTGFQDFDNKDYDVIINCIGFGAYHKGFDFYSMFNLTERFDNLIINYLNLHPECRYINFSSGTIYKQFDIHSIKEQDFLTIVKLNQFAKHRSLKNLCIIDLILYSYFSRWANIEDSYFMNLVIKALQTNKEFETNTHDFTRDYVSPKDLFDGVKDCFNLRNCFFTISSSKSVTKWEILEYFRIKYELKILLNNIEFKNITGEKPKYIPECFCLFSKRTSMETIIEESKYFLKT